MVCKTFIVALVLLGFYSVALSSPANLETLEEARLFKPLNSHPCQCCVCFAIDESGSINDPEWNDQVNFVKSLAQFHNLFNLQRAMYSAVAFDWKARLIQGLTMSYPWFAHKLQNFDATLKYGTKINAGLDDCKNILSSNKWCTAKTIVLLSDGYDFSLKIPAVNAIKYMGISIISVGVGQHIEWDNLKKIASDPSCAFKAPESTLKSLPRVPPRGITASSTCSNKLIVDISSKFCRRVRFFSTRPPTRTIRTDIFK